MTDAVAEGLWRDLGARGPAPCLRVAERVLGADAVLAMLEATAAEVLDAIEGLRPGHVVGLRGGRPFLQVAVPLAAWRRGLSTFLLGPREPDAAVPALLAEAGCAGYVACDAAGAIACGAAPTPHPLRWPTCRTLLRTSGSAGRPKIAVHELGAHVRSARAAASFLDLGPADTWLLSLPVHHVGGLGILLRCLVAGAVLAVPDPDAALPDALERFAPTHLSLVPTQLGRLLRDEAACRRLRRCRAVLVGGAPISAPLRAAALGAGIPLVVSYGATETTALAAASADPAVVGRAQSAGRPLPGRTVRIASDGEIRVGGDALFAGYLVDGTVVDGRDADGFVRTGDRGRVDAEGVLYVEGRLDRMFITGGENVQPEELEAALEALPGVRAAVVVAIDDAEFGRRPVAFVDLADRALDAARLGAALRERLPAFKVPDAFYALPPPPEGALKPAVADLERLVGDAAAREALRPL